MSEGPSPLPFPLDARVRGRAWARRKGGDRTRTRKPHGPAGRGGAPSSSADGAGEHRAAGSLAGTGRLAPCSNAPLACRTLVHGNGARGVQITDKIVSVNVRQVMIGSMQGQPAGWLPAWPVPGLVQPGQVGVVGVEMLVVVDGAPRPGHSRFGGGRPGGGWLRGGFQIPRGVRGRGR